jgi:hypothetical protein
VVKVDPRTSIRYIVHEPMEPLKRLAFPMRQAVGRQVRRAGDDGLLWPDRPKPVEDDDATAPEIIPIMSRA